MPKLEKIKENIQARDYKITVIGLGYVGLPLATAFVKGGFPLFGLDQDQEKVAALLKGESYIDDISSQEIKEALERGFCPTSSQETALLKSDAVFICVPTPLKPSKDPDLSYIKQAGEAVARYLKGSELVVLVSTTYPGTTEEILLPLLSEGGRKVGEDFFLAFAPERVDPGNKIFKLNNTPKVVGGVTPACTELAVALFSQVVEKVVPVSSPKVAEMSKLLENTYRVVNISLVNELAQLARRMGINIWEVIEAASTKPYGFTSFYPGPGMGGHCIPIDPFYLSWKARAYDFDLRFVELAGQINDFMPYYVLSLVMDALNQKGKPLKDSKILVLGVAYKENIGDVREAPALKIIKLLEEKGASLKYCDPYVPSISFSNQTLYSLSLEEIDFSAFDCLLLITAHSAFPYAQIASSGALIVDTRNAFRDFSSENIIRL